MRTNFRHVSALIVTLAVLFTLCTISKAASTPPVGGNLIGAYDGSQVVIDGGAINGDELQTWVDQSPASNNANNVSGAITRRPILVPNGLLDHNTISFNGADRESLFFDNATTSYNTNQYTVFSVFKFNTNSATPNLIRVDDATSNFNWGAFGNSGDSLVFHGRGGSFQGASVNVPSGEWLVFTGVLDGSAGTDNVINTVELLETGASATTTTTGALTFGTHQRTTIGARPDFAAGDWLDGEIAELLVYNTALSGVQQAAVQDYLRTKFSAVPEPSTWALGLMGFIGLLLVNGRRQRRK